MGDTLPRGRLPPPRLPPPPPQANINYVHRDEIGENVSSILLKGFQKLQITLGSSQSLLSLQKIKEYIRVEGGTLYPGVDCPPLPQVNSDYVHSDEIGENVSSILLNGFQKF